MSEYGLVSIFQKFLLCFHDTFEEIDQIILAILMQLVIVYWLNLKFVDVVELDLSNAKWVHDEKCDCAKDECG